MLQKFLSFVFFINVGLCSIEIDVPTLIPEIAKNVDTLGQDINKIGNSLNDVEGQSPFSVLKNIVPIMDNVVQSCADSGHQLSQILNDLQKSHFYSTSSDSSVPYFSIFYIPEDTYDGIQSSILDLILIVNQTVALDKQLLNIMSDTQSIRPGPNGTIELPVNMVQQFLSTTYEEGKSFEAIGQMNKNILTQMNKLILIAKENGLEVYMPFLLNTINMITKAGNDYTEAGQAFIQLFQNLSKIKPLGIAKYPNGIYLEFDSLTLLQVFTRGAENLGTLFNDCANVYYQYTEQVETFFANVLQNF